ncbi:hypothetical protein BLA60_04055 [Actinophytocola xinjiangensis]|uniref:DUF6351 domain-containing protein n=1 Tax=Actinophytocola xinjiangensis TaxID=485602 RepID=A0A7Z0WUI6_9PSEU|nr:DUF6351 family protein [Actinophytocola xinjiangensis]OLF14316.1 hypothetical protein BLA60_04055 [Actinophytocola xinjiangensis]
MTRRLRSTVVAAGVVAVLASTVTATAEGGGPRLVSLSARPDLATAGDVLVAADVPPGKRVRITLNGADITDSFRPAAHRLTGLVDHLRPGRNHIVATAGNLRDQLVVTNHPATGPVISGPHQTPFACTTDLFRLVDGSTLGAPLDDDCSIATRVDYAYRSTDGRTKPLPDSTDRPGDLAWTTTSTGATVPFLIRVETGTLNRAIYQISMLHDPATDEPTFHRRGPGWNDRLIYTFGGGCRRGWYTQGTDTGGVLDPRMLGRGYAVASASLNVFGNNCNDLLAAETMMMVKERFVERYGDPLFTIGWGSSGGAYQSHQIADNYPGLLDGIVVGRSFPDVVSATNFTLFDARLLEHYFTEVAPGEFSQEAQRQVSGFLRWQSIGNLSDGANRLDPDAEFPAELPAALRYDAETNPGGARGDVYDHTANVFGRDPATGFARRPLDNVGVQYGLAALNAGAITTRQFLDLNEGIGGLDLDARPTPHRTEADPIATRAAYRTGRILSGGLGLADVPIIDYRTYSEDAANGDIHMTTHGFATRARLEAANGDADNQVFLVEDGRYGGFSLTSPVLREALSGMDQWLTGLAADGSGRSAHQRVVRNKPADLTDTCWSRDAQPRRIVQPITVDNTGECGRLYPAYATPRLVAGAPLTDDVVACRRKDIERSDYLVDLTPAEWTRLRVIFPTGVCDWSKPGAGQQRPHGTWQVIA